MDILYRMFDFRGERADIEEEDDQESFFRYMEENPNAGVIFTSTEDDAEIEYDEDGNPIPPEKSKVGKNVYNCECFRDFKFFSLFYTISKTMQCLL